MKTQLLAMSLLVMGLLFPCIAKTQSHLYPVVQNNKWGAIDSTGEIKVPLEFDRVVLKGNTVFAGKSDEHWLMPVDGKKLAGPFSLAKPIWEDLILVEQKGLKGLWHRDGYMLFACQYDKIEIGNGGLIDLVKGGQKGLARIDGSILIPPVYTEIEELKAGNYRCTAESGSRMYNIHRQSWVEGTWEDVTQIGRGFGGVKDEDGWKLVDRKGEVVQGVNLQNCKAAAPDRLWAMEDGLWYLIDATGDKVYEEGFEKVDKFAGKFAKVGSGRKMGLIHREGKLVLPCEYDAIQVGAFFVSVIKEGKREKLPLSESGELRTGRSFVLVKDSRYEVREPVFNGRGNASVAGTGWFQASNEKWGLRLGQKVVISPRYDEVHRLDGELSLTAQHVRGSDLIGVTDHEKGQILLAPSMILCDPAEVKRREAFRALMSDEKMVLLSAAGERLSPREVNYIGAFQNGVAPACVGCRLGGRVLTELKSNSHRLNTFFMAKRMEQVEAIGGKWGFLDISGHWVQEPVYERLVPFNKSGQAQFKKDSLWGLLGPDLEVVCPPRYSWIRFAKQGNESSYCVMSQKDLWGFEDRSGNMAIEARFAGVGQFREGLCPAAEKKYDPRKEKMVKVWGYIDNEGNWVIPPKYEEVGDFHQGRAWVQVGRYSYLIDAQGKNVVDQGFYKHGPFCEGKARVYHNYRWGYIDREGKWLVEAEYLDAKDFYQGQAAVRYKKGWKLIDGKGKKVGKLTLDEVNTWIAVPDSSEGDPSLLPVNHGSLMGLISVEGKQLVPPLYNIITWSDGLWKVYRDGVFGYLNVRGDWVWELQK